MERTERITTGVFDAGPIIHLDELACLDLLSDFSENLVPDSVWQEVDTYRPVALRSKHVSLNRLKRAYYPDRQLSAMCRVFSLDAGETEALSVMTENPTAAFFTDDAAARLVAQQMGYQVHGTIGILVRSIRRELRDPEQVLCTLDDIPLKSTLYVKRSLLEEVKMKVRFQFHL